MPSLREEEPRRRKKDYDRDTSSRTSKTDKERHRSSTKKTHRRRSSTSREASRDRSPSRLGKASQSDLNLTPGKKVTMLVPEMERRSSTGTRSSAYPTFSKDHSKESVREDLTKSKTSVSSNGRDGTTKSRSSQDGTRADSPTATNTSKPSAPTRTPPSPPLTEEEMEAKRASSKKNPTDKLKAEARRSRHRSSDSLRPSSSTSTTHKSSSRRRRPSPEDTETSDASDFSHSLSDRSPDKSKHSDSTLNSKKSFRSAKETSSLGDHASLKSSTVTQHTQDSQATSVPEKQPGHGQRPPGLTTTDPYSAPSQPSPQTPIGQYHNPNISPSKGSPGYYDHTGAYVPPQPVNLPPPPPTGSMYPPPPPPLSVPEVNPRVDYLLENGGLSQLIPRTLLPMVNPQPIQSFQSYNSPRLNQGTAPNDLVQIFAPIHSRLEDYMKVINKNGSVAVATGYRSVARKLLDRLETVFSRDISNEKCYCVMCKTRPPPQLSDEEEKGVSWGGLLEFVSGRRELPQWPPFTITSQPGGLGIANVEPMQQMDPDVPPEWRDHYTRQNAKTKRAVEGWLSQNDDSPTSAPTEVDDETLTFAITTHLEPERRPLFIALKKGMSEVPRVEPTHFIKNDVLSKVGLALRRLYRLPTLPRESECCIYLLNNPTLHNTIFTLAAVTEGEWDILVSGRFDGFLISGAEDLSQAYGSGVNISRLASGTPFSRNGTPFSANGGVPLSRGNTPFSPLRNVVSPDGGMFPSRGATPAPSMGSMAAPAPVQVDEETEIQVLAEIEREIFRGMEALEDQFERLHHQAEAVCKRLRERGTGLQIARHARRGSLGSEPGVVRGGTPMSMGGYSNGIWTPDLQEGLFFDDGRSELAPDDSASNIGFARRHHRREGRHSRNTPAPVAEEDEEYDAGDKKKAGSFRRRR